MRRRKTIRLALDLFADLLLVVLAGDLLYLYFAGAWYDPILAILIIELIVLWVIVIFGLLRFWIRVKEVSNGL